MFRRLMTPKLDPQVEDNIIKGHLDTSLINLSPSISDYIMHLAIKHNHLHIIKQLQSLGTLINNSHLNYACKYGHLSIIMHMIKSGVQPFTLKDECISIAADFGHISTVIYLFGLQDIIRKDMPTTKMYILKGNAVLSHLTEAITRAVVSGHIHIVKFLLENGLDQVIYVAACNNQPDEEYRIVDRLIHSAINNNHTHILEYLLHLGADVHSYNDYALQLAVNKHNMYYAGLLLQYGADIKNSQALQLSILNNDQQMNEYLSEWMYDTPDTDSLDE